MLGTTGTELLQFGLLVAIGVWFARRDGRSPRTFVAAALTIVSLFYFLCPETSGFQQRVGDVLMSGMARLQAQTMQVLFGSAVYAQGHTVAGGGFNFTYARGCMGLSYLAMAVLVLLVQPVSWRRRLAGVPVLVAGMLALNLARLVVLYQLWAGGHAGAYEAFHRVGGGLFALGAFGLYAGILAVGRRPAAAPAARPAVAAA